MLEDVSTHLDGAGLPPDDLASWNERFGSPRDYALQLRSDLGLRTDPKSLGRARIRHVRHVRLRTKLLIGLAFLVSGATSAGVLWVRNLQPFRFDNL